MKIFDKIKQYCKDGETKRFISWLISFSLTQAGIMYLFNVNPVFCIVVYICYLWNIVATLNWVTK